MSEQRDNRAVRPYDFRRPTAAHGAAHGAAPNPVLGLAATAAQSRSALLEALHLPFAARFAAVLSAHLRVHVDVALTHAERLRYDEFLRSIGPLTCLSVLRVDPPGAQAILDLSLPVARPMIQRLLGGRLDPTPGDAQLPHVALTQIEQALALQIVERAAAELADTWSGVMPQTNVREEASAADPDGVRIMPAEEIVTALRFEVRIAGPSVGVMSLCLPEPVVAMLEQPAAALPPAAAAPMPAELQRQDLHRNILDAAVELRALLAETKVRLSDVLTMQAGDLITTDKHAGTEVQVQLQVEGKDKFDAEPGQLRGSRVVQITRTAPRLEQIEPPTQAQSNGGVAP